MRQRTNLLPAGTAFTDGSRLVARLSRSRAEPCPSPDRVVGAVFACALCHAGPYGADAVHDTLSAALHIQRTFQSLRNNLAWLQRNPAGFKLDPVLTEQLQRHLLAFLDSYRRIAQTVPRHILRLAPAWASRRLLLLTFLVLLSTTLGFSAVLAFYIDIVRLRILPVRLLSRTFRTLLRIQHNMLRSLLRLFRGKKYNILRHRTDSLKDVIAITLSLVICCFCICIFSWTTLVVHHVFFAYYSCIVLELTTLTPLVLLDSTIEQLFVRPYQQQQQQRVAAIYYTKIKCDTGASTYQIQIERVPYTAVVRSNMKSVFETVLAFVVQTLRQIVP